MLTSRASFRFVGLMALGVLPRAGLGQPASFQGLGDLPDGSFSSHAQDVSEDGNVVVGWSTSSNGMEAFWWVAGQMIGLGDLPGGEVLSHAAGVSSDGSVVVGYAMSELDPGGSEEAFRWANRKMSGLGDLPGGAISSRAYAVSAGGSVVVGQGRSSLGEEAFRWEGGVMTGLGDLVGGAFVSAALAVSADGSVIVGRGRSGSGTEAFRWSNGVMTGLGDLPGGSFLSSASGVSADGSIIVGQGDGASGTEAVMWVRDALTGLGELPGGPFHSYATDISADGRVVVGQSYGGNGLEAFVWTATDGMRSVRELLVEAGVFVTGWTLWAAQGVSADGSVIVGEGVNPQGNSEAWRAVLPPRPTPTQPVGAPNDLVLHPPVPNPAIGRTVLRYDVPATGLTRLALYDSRVREVAMHVHGHRPAGPYQATLDARRLSPGVYVVRLEAGGRSVERLLTVAR